MPQVRPAAALFWTAKVKRNTWLAPLVVGVQPVASPLP
jgi:hypothetical protein